GRLHRLSEAQDRGWWKAAVDPDDSRRRLRAARAMSFRTRLALVAAAAVALAVVAASFAVFFIVKGQLYGSVDDSLRRSAALVQRVDPHEIPHFTSPQFRAIGGVTQVVGANGATFPPDRIL